MSEWLTVNIPYSYTQSDDENEMDLDLAIPKEWTPDKGMFLLEADLNDPRQIGGF